MAEQTLPLEPKQYDRTLDVMSQIVSLLRDMTVEDIDLVVRAIVIFAEIQSRKPK